MSLSQPPLQYLAELLTPLPSSHCVYQSGDETQACFQNRFNKTVLVPPLPGAQTCRSDTDCGSGGICYNGKCTAEAVGVNWRSASAPPQKTPGTQYYLGPPFDIPYEASQIEFTVTPSGSGGAAAPPVPCSHNSNGPDDCLKNEIGGDPDSKYCQFGAMPCLPGSKSVKVGPCLSFSDGTTMQGWQCKSTNWDCDYNSGKCVPSQTGAFATEDACKKECVKCPAPDFTVGPGGKCYRSAFGIQQHYDGGASCIGSAWTYQGSCACTDTVISPPKAYQCKSEGYVECTDPSGCQPPQVVWYCPPSGGSLSVPCQIPEKSDIARRNRQSPERWDRPFSRYCLAEPGEYCI